MANLVILKFGEGSWQQGCPGVTVQLWQDHSALSSQFAMSFQCIGSLPPAPELVKLYEQWRSLYTALTNRLVHCRTLTIEIEAEGITNVSRTNFDSCCVQLKHAFNLWLETKPFSRIEQQLRTKLLPSQAIRVIIEAEDPLLRRFPWHLWNFFDDYPLAEVALSVPEYERVLSPLSSPHLLSPHLSSSHPSSPHVVSNSVRILAVLGNSQGIDVQHDRTLLQQLPQTETVVLVEPDRTELNHWLWDEQGWDILFFAGHSTSQRDGSTGELALNPTDNLTIEQLRHALNAAISRGIKLAIFNSCDGVGLARSMADLNIPQLIVMREPIPDRIAQEFLKHFLTAFAQGKPLYPAVREAREKLQGWEHTFPCASWLPIIFQNPAEETIEWEVLTAKREKTQKRGDAETETRKGREGDAGRLQTDQLTNPSSAPLFKRRGLKIVGMTSLFITSLLMGIRFLGGFQAWELAAFDHLMRLRPQESIDPRLLVVEVSQPDIEQYGYPLDDATLATLIEKLETYQPRAIGLDMHRAQPRGQGRAEFINQFQRHRNLFLACSFGATDQNAPPFEFSTEQRINQVGFSDLILEGININGTMRDDLLSEQSGEQGDMVRRQLLSYDPTLATTPSFCTTPYSLSLQLAAQFFSQTGNQPIAVNAEQNWQLGSLVLKKLPNRFGGYQHLDGLSSQILINYRTNPPGARLTLSQVLQGQVDRHLVENRIVLIGTTAPAAKDYFDTLYGEMPGVWIHAHMLSQILSAVMDDRPLVWALPQWGGWQWGDWVWVLGWSAVGGSLAWRLRSWLWLGMANAIATVALHQLCLAILVQGGWMPLIPSLLALWTTSFVFRVVMTSEIRRSV